MMVPWKLELWNFTIFSCISSFTKWYSKILKTYLPTLLKVNINSQAADIFEVSMPLNIASENQNVRIEFTALDYRSAVTNNDPTIWFEFFVRYSDQTTSEKTTMNCMEKCIDGVFFIGYMDIEQNRVDQSASLIIKGYASSVDKISLSKVSCCILQNFWLVAS